MPIVPAPADDPPCLLDGADMGLSRTNGAVGPRGNIELPALCVTPADNLTRFADRAGAPPPRRSTEHPRSRHRGIPARQPDAGPFTAKTREASKLIRTLNLSINCFSNLGFDRVHNIWTVNHIVVRKVCISNLWVYIAVNCGAFEVFLDKKNIMAFRTLLSQSALSVGIWPSPRACPGSWEIRLTKRSLSSLNEPGRCRILGRRGCAPPALTPQGSGGRRAPHPPRTGPGRSPSLAPRPAHRSRAGPRRASRDTRRRATARTGWRP